MPEGIILINKRSLQNKKKNAHTQLRARTQKPIDPEAKDLKGRLTDQKERRH